MAADPLPRGANGALLGHRAEDLVHTISANSQNRHYSGRIAGATGARVPILPENCQGQNEERKSLRMENHLLRLIAASLPLALLVETSTCLPTLHVPLAAKLADDVFRGKIQVHLRRGQPIMPENVLQGSGRGIFCQNYFPEYPFTYL